MSVLLAATAVWGIHYARPRVVDAMQKVTVRSDVFALPPPSVLVELSLGYRAALADLLFTSTIVSYGIHGEEHRRFEFIGQYLDSIVAVDPHLCQIYRYADTFIIYQPVGAPGPDEVRHLKDLLEKGLEMCPNDGRLWLSAGQFLAFIGTQFVTDEKEKENLRLEGARVLARAAELASGDNENVQWQALAAAGIFTREGNREASIGFLERVYSVTDDEQLKANVAKKLRLLRDEGEVERAQKVVDAVSDERKRELPFVSKTGFLVLGPRRDAATCSGRDASVPGCADTWAGWAAQLR